MPIYRVRELYHRAQQPLTRSPLENLLSEMRVEYSISDADLARIPVSGPLLVTANHPFGLLDGAILGSVLRRVRPDVKILASHLLSGIAELHDYCFFIDPSGGREALPGNRRAIKNAIEWLNGGGVLAMFPAGEVSHLHFKQMQVADSEWNSRAARLVRATGAATLPVFLRGKNSAAFPAVNIVHSSLKTNWLLGEFLRHSGKKVSVRVGNPIPADVICHTRSTRRAASYLRWRTYLLAERDRTTPDFPAMLKSVLPHKKQEPLAGAISPSALQEEIRTLRPDRCLEQNREFSVYLAEAGEIPNLMQEAGRLRELTFRAAGEGTGKRTDLDNFDSYYKHLLLWSNTNNELVGAYRLGLTTEILPTLGVGGLYTSTLFHYHPTIFERMGPAVELGRSFIRFEYQRQYAPLLMIWKGIGRFLAAHPKFAVLFGAVSISSRYNLASRELIVRFFQGQERRQALLQADYEPLGNWVKPRSPFRPRMLNSPGSHPACDDFSDLQDLADPIADVETDGKGVPILLKHYAKLGGRLISFNVDRNFSGVLDGFVLVDLRRSNPAVLARYMGKDGLAAFQHHHQLTVATSSM